MSFRARDSEPRNYYGDGGEEDFDVKRGFLNRFIVGAPVSPRLPTGDEYSSQFRLLIFLRKIIGRMSRTPPIRLSMLNSVVSFSVNELVLEVVG
jgi:hypothetical protein